jgi:hypothetical protein
MEKQVIARMSDAVLAALLTHATARRARADSLAGTRHLYLARAERKRRYMRARRAKA